ncbi:unnamed protein product [Adineta steineri]|uniref:ADP-ribosylglycohydrolase n=1 Tax=Adineta steineri TaxID=433720 RepID=A0A819H3X0_9BILA|nr:unnamed protein product [Adineta steineri]
MENFKTSQYNSVQQENQLYTLPQLLNTKQPYKEFRNLYDPDLDVVENEMIRKIQGSLVGLAVGDALGASVEFRSYEYLQQHPVRDMQYGGTWGLQAGQWTDDTSMALCLAASLIIKGKSDIYDQFTRYKRWYRNGYMSSTGKCFDIGNSTRQAITDFENRQRLISGKMMERNISNNNNIFPPTDDMIAFYFDQFGVDAKCGLSDAAGNGSLMRLTPIPSFFFQSYENVKQYLDDTTKLTHGDQRAIDACQFYAGLIWYALNGMSKKKLLDPDFYRDYLNLSLHKDVLRIARGSYKKKKGYENGIRGTGYVIHSLEAALWAFYNDENSFEKGVLDAVNLGDDTDTTAAIYGQLAGAMYGIESIPDRWVRQLFEDQFIMTIAKGLYVKGKQFSNGQYKSAWLDGDEQQYYQANINNLQWNERKSNEGSTTSSDRDTNKYKASYNYHDTSSNSSSRHHRSVNRDSTFHRGQQARANNTLRKAQSAHTNRSHRHQFVNSKRASRRNGYEKVITISQTKQRDKVITEQ